MWPVTCNFRLIYFYFDWIKLYWASTACKKMLGKENWFEPQYKHFPGVRTSLVAQRVKPPPTVQETRVWSLGWEDLLETGMATHCSILAHPTPRPPHTQKKGAQRNILKKAMATHSSTLEWKIPWAEEPGRLQSMGSWRVRPNWATLHHFSLSCIGEGNGNPLQCSCLENPRDGGVWWTAIYGVIQSRTWLKWLSSSSRNTYLAS